MNCLASSSSRCTVLSNTRTITVKRLKWLPNRRHAHMRVPLKYNVEEGLGAFLPPAALKTIAVEYQQGLLDRLMDLVKDTEHDRKSVAQTVISLAPDRTKTLAFNYASQALNNSFFLSQLKPTPTDAPNHENKIDHAFLSTIRTQFGSLSQLRSTASAAAMGMSSSGWVWLVTDGQGQLAVKATFGAGTMLVRSRMQLTPNEGLSIGEVFRDINGAPLETKNDAATSVGSSYLSLGSSPEAAEGNVAIPQESSEPSVSVAPSGVAPASPTSAMTASMPPITPTAGSSRSYSSGQPSNFLRGSTSIYSSTFGIPNSGRNANADITTVGQTLYPLFCISVHEHAWLSAGFGIWGKEDWLKEFWRVLDWESVTAASNKWHSIKR